MTAITYSSDDIRYKFECASRTALLFPSVLPKSAQSNWPDLIRSLKEGHVEGSQIRSVTTAEIAEYETVASWITFVSDAHTRRMVWAVSTGQPAWKIRKALLPAIKVSASTINRHAAIAFALIAEKLNAGEVPPPPSLNA